MNNSRTELMDRRYTPAPHPHKPRRIARFCLSWTTPHMRVLQGTASMHRTHSGILYNLRLRLVRRFGLSPFKLATKAEP